MQIVSGRPGHELVHYMAPASAEVPREMARFLRWFEATRPGRGAASSNRPAADGLTRAAIAHLWFETIHPFEDGNGRIGRAIADMALAQDLGVPTRLYSLSAQLLASRGAFLGGLSADKYVRMTGASKATATRDLAALLQHGLLRVQGSGKATRYQVNVPEWGHAGAG